VDPLRDPVKGVMTVEDWAGIRRLRRSEGMAIKAIARELGISRNPVRRALARDTAPRYERCFDFIRSYSYVG
jgi:DNA-binding phage protein